MRSKYKISALILILALIWMQEAKAYINPGTGSYFFQAVASFFMGIVFFFKNIARAVGLIKEDKAEDEN